MSIIRYNVRVIVGLLALIGLVPSTAGCGSDEGDGNAGPPGNRAPNIDPVDPQDVDEGEELVLVFTVSDPDGDTLYLEARNLPADASFDPIRGRLIYQPGHGVVSPDEGSLALPDVTVQVDDLYATDSTTVSITVHHVNRPPFFLGADAGPLSELNAEVDPGMQQQLRFQVVDPDGDAVSLQLVGSPAYARLDGTVLMLEPTEGDDGSVDSFEIKASDGAAEARLPVRVVVGDLVAEIPQPTGLAQAAALEGNLAVGGSAFEGLFTFSASPHAFAHAPLRLQVEVAEVGELYEDGIAGIGAPVAVGTAPRVDMTLVGGAEYRWRARFLSDEFGPGPYASFGGNADSEADLAVSIVPETALNKVPHDPSPVDVTFEFSSPNVTDFECRLDSANTSTCSSPKSYFGLADGEHTFAVQGMTRDGMRDPTPAEHTWEVISGLAIPDTQISNVQLDDGACTARFTFTAVLPQNESAGFFECCLEKLGLGGTTCGDDTDFETCWPPQTYDVEDGDFRFNARAVNIVGQRDSTPATHTFSMSCD